MREDGTATPPTGGGGEGGGAAATTITTVAGASPLTAAPCREPGGGALSGDHNTKTDVGQTTASSVIRSRRQGHDTCLLSPQQIAHQQDLGTPPHQHATTISSLITACCHQPHTTPPPCDSHTDNKGGGQIKASSSGAFAFNNSHQFQNTPTNTTTTTTAASAGHNNSSGSNGSNSGAILDYPRNPASSPTPSSPPLSYAFPNPQPSPPLLVSQHSASQSSSPQKNNGSTMRNGNQNHGAATANTICLRTNGGDGGGTTTTGHHQTGSFACPGIGTTAAGHTASLSGTATGIGSSSSSNNSGNSNAASTTVGGPCRSSSLAGAAPLLISLLDDPQSNSNTRLPVGSGPTFQSGMMSGDLLAAPNFETAGTASFASTAGGGGDSSVSLAHNSIADAFSFQQKVESNGGDPTSSPDTTTLHNRTSQPATTKNDLCSHNADETDFLTGSAFLASFNQPGAFSESHRGMVTAHGPANIATSSIVETTTYIHSQGGLLPASIRTEKVKVVNETSNSSGSGVVGRREPRQLENSQGCHQSSARPNAEEGGGVTAPLGVSEGGDTNTTCYASVPELSLGTRHNALSSGADSSIHDRCSAPVLSQSDKSRPHQAARDGEVKWLSRGGMRNLPRTNDLEGSSSIGLRRTSKDLIQDGGALFSVAASDSPDDGPMAGVKPSRGGGGTAVDCRQPVGSSPPAASFGFAGKNADISLGGRQSSGQARVARKNEADETPRYGESETYFSTHRRGGQVSKEDDDEMTCMISDHQYQGTHSTKDRGGSTTSLGYAVMSEEDDNGTAGGGKGAIGRAVSEDDSSNVDGQNPHYSSCAASTSRNQQALLCRQSLRRSSPSGSTARIHPNDADSSVRENKHDHSGMLSSSAHNIEGGGGGGRSQRAQRQDRQQGVRHSSSYADMPALDCARQYQHTQKQARGEERSDHKEAGSKLKQPAPRARPKETTAAPASREHRSDVSEQQCHTHTDTAVQSPRYYSPVGMKTPPKSPRGHQQQKPGTPHPAIPSCSNSSSGGSSSSSGQHEDFFACERLHEQQAHTSSAPSGMAASAAFSSSHQDDRGNSYKCSLMRFPSESAETPAEGERANGGEERGDNKSRSLPSPCILKKSGNGPGISTGVVTNSFYACATKSEKVNTEERDLFGSFAPSPFSPARPPAFPEGSSPNVLPTCAESCTDYKHGHSKQCNTVFLPRQSGHCTGGGGLRGGGAAADSSPSPSSSSSCSLPSRENEAILSSGSSSYTSFPSSSSSVYSSSRSTPSTSPPGALLPYTSSSVSGFEGSNMPVQKQAPHLFSTPLQHCGGAGGGGGGGGRAARVSYLNTISNTSSSSVSTMHARYKTNASQNQHTRHDSFSMSGNMSSGKNSNNSGRSRTGEQANGDKRLAPSNEENHRHTNSFFAYQLTSALSSERATPTSPGHTAWGEQQDSWQVNVTQRSENGQKKPDGVRLNSSSRSATATGTPRKLQSSSSLDIGENPLTHSNASEPPTARLNSSGNLGSTANSQETRNSKEAASQREGPEQPPGKKTSFSSSVGAAEQEEERHHHLQEKIRPLLTKKETNVPVFPSSTPRLSLPPQEDSERGGRLRGVREDTDDEGEDGDQLAGDHAVVGNRSWRRRGSRGGGGAAAAAYEVSSRAKKGAMGSQGRKTPAEMREGEPAGGSRRTSIDEGNSSDHEVLTERNCAQAYPPLPGEQGEAVGHLRRVKKKEEDEKRRLRGASAACSDSGNFEGRRGYHCAGTRFAHEQHFGRSSGEDEGNGSDDVAWSNKADVGESVGQDGDEEDAQRTMTEKRKGEEAEETLKKSGGGRNDLTSWQLYATKRP